MPRNDDFEVELGVGSPDISKKNAWLFPPLSRRTLPVTELRGREKRGEEEENGHSSSVAMHLAACALLPVCSSACAHSPLRHPLGALLRGHTLAP